MFMEHLILVINPGSTSTKIAIFQDAIPQIQKNIHHPPAELAQYPKIWSQLEYRLKAIQDFLVENKISLEKFSAIVARGGLLKPIKGGTYIVSPNMLHDSEVGIQGEHAANLACALAYRLAQPINLPAYVVDPISVDEFEPLSRVSGHPLIERRCLSHTLNIHAVGREAARILEIDYEKSNFIIAHLGGGISVCPLKSGRIMDVNDASSDGPFSPERTGGLPLQQFISLCFSNKYTESQMKRLVMGEGGLIAYLKTNNATEIETRIQQGDQNARLIYEAMAYQIAKEIGAMSTVVSGKIDAIVLTGGLAGSKMLMDWIKGRVEFIAKVLILPGEFEMEALVNGVLRVLDGSEKALDY
ncbi:butyrate kinase [candidate division KSB1 bacterium]|nr:butyrate kinase [candidate division KSB1 bacterium]